MKRRRVETDSEEQKSRTCERAQIDELSNGNTSERTVEEDEVHKKILDKTGRILKDIVIPDLIIEADSDGTLFDFTTKRDIQEQETTTKKNKLILDIVRRKGKTSFRDFKELLNKTGQGKLVELLNLKENGQDTKEIERDLYEMADKCSKWNHEKKQWRNMMIEEYKNTVLKVPAMPTLPDEECEFSKIYVRPIIITERKENCEVEEIEIKSMSEIFTRSGTPLKSIYVVGDAGTGKSSFCIYLVNCWCIAHSEGQVEEDDFYGVKEMKKFEFLFFIPLRQFQSIEHVHDMLKKLYDIDILDTLLKKDSAKILILLDGLDEWSPEGKMTGLPIHSSYKQYTIITTSRPWKIHTLRIKNKEMLQLLKLKGFDEDGEAEIIRRTVSYLNHRNNAEKHTFDCQLRLEGKSFKKLKEVPIMLQQLVCLWFDGKLDKSSRCAVYSGMLKLFFSWNEDKTAGTSSENKGESHILGLPACLADNEICLSNSDLIYDMSRLAYETLFECPKAESLTFDFSIFRKLKLSDKVRNTCLKVGILTEDRCPSLSVSERPQSMFSFIHKSVQEFLVAVNIAVNFNTKMNSSGKLTKEDLEKECIQIVNDVFQKCSTVNEILEQSNVIIMLRGLEPRLGTSVQRYIYDIVNRDP